MKVLGRRVLIEQTMIRKVSVLVSSKDPNSIDNFDITQKVIGIGNDVPADTIEIGDTPILGKYSEPSAVKVIEKNDNKMISHIIMDYDNICGIDDIEIQ